LILKAGIDDAIHRARRYIEAGADAIMIHSKDKTPDEVFEFLRRYSEFKTRVPVVAVPTSYNSATEAKLHAAGVDIVIYANHLLRSAYPAMVATARSILTHERSLEAQDLCMPIGEILQLIPGGK
jgi:phosphoenolpyruvate phosphomutase